MKIHARRWSELPPLLALALAIGACDEGAPTSPARPTSSEAPSVSAAVHPDGVDACGDPLEVDLLADQDIDVGSVTVANDEENLYVTYATSDGWTLRTTHLEVATSVDGVPTNKKGQPILGQFTFEDTHDGVTQVSYTVPLSDLGLGPGDKVVVAAHADVFHASLDREEGAWSAGPLIESEGNWATFTSHTVQACIVVLDPTESCADHDADAIGTFADPNLEAAVRDALGVEADADLTCGLLATLTELTARNAGIADLAGAQNLTGLTSLDLSTFGLSGEPNSVSDLGPLSGLTGLTVLRLTGNEISDLRPLSGLTSLTWLALTGNEISDLGPLSGVTDLSRLDVASNPVSDLGPLSALTGLRSLNVNNNAVSDLSPLSGLTGLVNLFAFGNAISDIGPLSGLTNLVALNLGGNSIVDVSPVEGLTRLFSLGLTGNSDLADIQPLLDNSGLGPGDAVTLRSTSVSCEDIAALEAKGVTVASDCP